MKDGSERPDWTLDHVPVAPFMRPRTASPPGIQPLDPAQWLFFSDDVEGQMALRDRLIEGEDADLGPAWMVAGGEKAAEELLDCVVDHLVSRGFGAVSSGKLRRKDGVSVDLSGPPMAVLGRLAPEDFLIMERPEGAEEHVLTAGVLLFPAHWTLSEKIGRPLVRIHQPVPDYEGDLSRRVQRFFDGVQVGRPLWRANWHFAGTPQIVTPMREVDKVGLYLERLPDERSVGWLRVERQTILRLPRTGAVVFGVRTLMSDIGGLTSEQWRGLQAAFAAMSAEERDGKATPDLLARIEAEVAAAA